MFGSGRLICSTENKEWGKYIYYEGWKNNTIQITEERRTGRFTNDELVEIKKMDWYYVKDGKKEKYWKDHSS